MFRFFVPRRPWPLTLTFKLIRARDQTCLHCEFDTANPFSSYRAIWVTGYKKTKVTDIAENATLLACANNVMIARCRQRITASLGRERVMRTRTRTLPSYRRRTKSSTNTITRRCPKSSRFDRHIPYICSPNPCLLFAAHAHTIATCVAVVSILYHLFLVFLSTPYLELYLLS